MHTVAFICSANLCRSLMAHAIFVAETRRRKLILKTLSAGMYNFEGVQAAREARLCCEKNGTPMVNFVSTYFRNISLAEAVRIFVMTKDHADLLSKETSILPERISLLGQLDPKHRGDEIEDPVGKDNAAFDLCYERLRDCIVNYLDSTRELS